MLVILIPAHYLLLAMHPPVGIDYKRTIIILLQSTIGDFNREHVRDVLNCILNAVDCSLRTVHFTAFKKKVVICCYYSACTPNIDYV